MGRSWIRRWLSLALLLGMCAGCSSWKQKMAVLDNESQDLVEQVRVASESGRQEQAAELLQQAVASNPNNAGVRKQLSEFLINNGYSEEAIQQLKKTMVLTPDDPKPYIDLAYLLREKKQYTDSLKNLELGLTLDPVNIRALLLKGELEELAGLNSAAVETYHRVLQVEPYNLVSRLKLAELQIKIGEPNRATPILRPICHNTAATIEQRAEARWLLGVAYGAEQRWNDSVKSLELALKNRTDATADDWYRMAYASLQANEMEKVYQSVTQALSLNPQHSETNRLSSYLTQQVNQLNIQQASLYTPLKKPGFIGQSAPRIPLETLQPPSGWQKTSKLSISSDSYKIQ
ncbi:MAG: tetratricopeptide repeat protein [Planctomycetes bacterium]|nr:tetratricopeptide repeat protein [Planctomycetota bacterium]MCH9724367.1 tetratricopeptide repeat protein [Planctomycetota bacterium]MCH9776188.1 tetratricopeptide repeat protein [Planctomycetota bacterium]MCH9790506.1 tetratricopeptide repeat protein [Planctomycetota bacterium]